MKTRDGVIVPTIHDNGSGRARILDTYDDAWHGVNEAYRRLKTTAPNARDYDCEEDYDRATIEHMSRLKRIDSINKELASIMVGITE